MLELIKNAFRISNDNIILGIPLIFFMWVTVVYISYAQYAATSFPGRLLAIITILLMLGAFMAGWFYMVKKAIKLSKKEFVMDNDRAKAVFNLFKQIPTGIGKYFLSFVGFSFLILFVFFILANILYIIGINTIGYLDIDPNQLKTIGNSAISVGAFIETLSESQVVRLFLWEVLFLIGYAIVMFLTSMWVPEIIYQTKNPLIALFKSIKKVFKKPLEVMCLFFFLGLTNMLIAFLASFAMYNPITYIIIMMVQFYFFIYAITLVFTFYEKMYVEEN